MAKVINIMADGSVCEDLSTYLKDHELPDNVKRLILSYIEDGRRMAKEAGG